GLLEIHTPVPTVGGDHDQSTADGEILACETQPLTDGEAVPHRHRQSAHHRSHRDIQDVALRCATDRVGTVGYDHRDSLDFCGDHHLDGRGWICVVARVQVG